MISGKQTLGSIDQALYGARGQIRDLDERIQNASTDLLRLGQSESEQYKALAKLHVDWITSGATIQSLHQTGHRLGELLAAREQSLQELQQQIDTVQARQTALEKERAAQARQAEQAAEALDAAEAAAQERLTKDAAYQTQLERAQKADQTAQYAEKKTQLAEQDRLEKGKPYEADRFFMYLWKRHYGTAKYRANPLIRFLDKRVARLCGYNEARANYAMLLEIPVRLQQHAERLRQQAEKEYEALRELEQAAVKGGDIPKLQEANDEEQQKVDALDEEIARNEKQFQSLLQQRAVFVAGEDDEFRQAVDTMAQAFRRENIITLRQAAQATPTPDDDAIIAQLSAIEQEKAQLTDNLAQYQQMLKGHQQRLQELEAVRRKFKSHRYDDMNSGFVNGAMLGVMLNEFLGGLLNGDNLWREIQRQQQTRRVRSNPTFGSGGFGRSGSVWRSGRMGGVFGGGGFRTGGGFGGSNDGFRTGGGF